MTSATKLPAWLETLAKSWDGCMHDAPGEMIDIGASIRTAASQAPTLTTAPVGYVLVPETPTAEMVAAYRKGGCSVFAMPGWRALLEAAPTHPAEGVPAAAPDARDAVRYRFLRDADWRSDETLEPVIRLQLNARWDEKIDAAIAAQAGKGVQHGAQ